ncbi:hypothetical protein D910_04830 [Dendroctonus ponderosae]|uniref:Uncharacterized protein n=1 Tax=Dendroctonus ponderosae TaxID=77166 RepID=U4U315_DENPD|nr:hypothetical protein D910_04830 [Dendroctonus ponderosae]
MLTELCTNLDDYMRSNKNITNMRATILLTFKKMFLDAGKSDLGAVIQQLSKVYTKIFDFRVVEGDSAIVLLYLQADYCLLNTVILTNALNEHSISKRAVEIYGNLLTTDSNRVTISQVPVESTV